MMTSDMHFMAQATELDEYMPKAPKPIHPVPKGLQLYRVKKSDMERVLMGKSWDSVLPIGVTSLNDERLEGHSLILMSGAKAMHYGNGWWSFFGYHYANKDVEAVLIELGIY